MTIRKQKILFVHSLCFLSMLARNQIFEATVDGWTYLSNIDENDDDDYFLVHGMEVIRGENMTTIEVMGNFFLSLKGLSIYWQQ